MQLFSNLPQGLAIAAAVVLVMIFVPRSFSARFESSFSRIANRHVLSFFALLSSVIVLRLALLPLLPIPIPGIHDEFSYLLMADTFAHGRLANPPHPMWVSFETFHINFLPTYSSMYPPAQGLFLAAGQLIGNPWFGVVFSDALLCAVIFWMLRAWMPPRWALLGGCLAALKLGIASYWMNSYWGGAVAAIGGALVLGGLPRLNWKTSRLARIRNAALIALGVAILANSRPYEGLLFAIPAVVWFLGWLFGRVQSQLTFAQRVRHALLPVALILATAGIFMGYYNYRLTGNPLLLPHTLNSKTYQRAGLFLWNRCGPPRTYNNAQFEAFYADWECEDYDRTLGDAVRVSGEKLVRLGSTFTWYGAALLLPALPLALVDRRMRLPLLTLCVGMAGTFVVIWSMAHYAAPMTCVILGFLVMALRYVRLKRFCSRRIGVALSWSAIILLVLQVGSNVSRKVCDPLSWTCEGDPSRQALLDRLSKTAEKHLIIVRYDADHNIHDEWVYNPANLDNARVLFARDINREQNRRLLEYFRDRTVWLINPDEDNSELIPVDEKHPIPPNVAQ